MRATLYDLGYSTDPTASDTITVNLWSPTHTNPSVYHNPDYTTKVIIHKNGTTTMNFPYAVVGNSYYIAIKHRSHLETWSKNSVVFTSSTSYNFSTAQSQAYDDGINYNLPMRNMGNGVFALYGGDVNDDGVVDITDMSLVDNDNIMQAFGYNATDITGNKATDISDMSIIDNNNNAYALPPLMIARPH